MTELGIDFSYFAYGFVHSFNRKKIQHSCRNEHRARIHHQQESWMIHSFRDHSIKILFRIAVRIFENTVINPHRKCSDVAGWSRDFNTRIQCGNVCCLSTTTAGPSDDDAIWINVGAGQQIIDGTDSMPNFPAQKICAGEISKVTENEMFGAVQVIAALVVLGIPELAAFALSYGVPSDHHVAMLNQTLAERLIIIFAARRMPSWNENTGVLFRAIVGHIHKSSHVDSRQAFVNQFFDVI